jgi:cyanide hydratase
MYVYISLTSFFPYISIRTRADPSNQTVTTAYAIETGTYTLSAWQTITEEGLKMNFPPGKAPTDPKIFNGHARIFSPDGRSIAPHPEPDFHGLLFVDVS